MTGPREGLFLCKLTTALSTVQPGTNADTTRHAAVINAEWIHSSEKGETRLQVLMVNDLAGNKKGNGAVTCFGCQSGRGTLAINDLYCTTNLQNTFAASDFSWLCQVLPCNSYVLSDQPPNAAFYLLPPFELTQVVGWGDETDGECDVPGAVTNAISIAAGGQFSLALLNNGTVIGWGDDTYGQTDIPAGLTNVTAIAAGQFQGIALLANGAVTNWGSYWNYNNTGPVIDTNLASQPPTNGVVAVAAGWGHALALMTNGTVVGWGLNGDEGLNVPPGLTNVTAIACGLELSVALLGDGTVKAWGANLLGETNVPSGLSNVIAISANTWNTLALQSNGTVVAWGVNSYGETNVPSSLSNVVAVAAGLAHSLALTSNGHVVGWGDNSAGQYNFPSNMSNCMAIAAGELHSLALLNDGTLFTCGDNTFGETNLPYASTNFPVKLIAAGGGHSMAALWSPLVQYPVDVSKDLLLIYNTNSLDSSNVCQYYLTHRPMVSNANVLGVGVTTNDPILPWDFTTNFQPQVQMWLSNNPTLRPQYAILFQDVPQEVDGVIGEEDTNPRPYAEPSVQYQLHNSTMHGWSPFVTAINMNGMSGSNFYGSDGTNDCIAYIDKLIKMASNNPPGTLIISATAAGYGNTNWYFDDSWSPGVFSALAYEGVTNVDPTASVFVGNSNFFSLATNVAGYLAGGWDGGMGTGPGRIDSFATNGQVAFYGDSGWYIMTSPDSFSGQRVTFQSSYLTWFASNAFGGTNYSNTPVGAAGTVDDPGSPGTNPGIYYGEWAAGKSFAISAWAGMTSQYSQAVGDPFTRK